MNNKEIYLSDEVYHRKINVFFFVIQ